MVTALPQHNRLRAYCKIIVNRRNVTNFFDPYLISVEVIDTIKELFDRCDIEAGRSRRQARNPARSRAGTGLSRLE
jgi:hypothetical protein